MFKWLWWLKGRLWWGGAMSQIKKEKSCAKPKQLPAGPRKKWPLGRLFSSMIYFTQLYNPSKHMFNVWRLRIALQWVWCCLLLDQAYQPPQPDRQHRNLVMIEITINIILIVMTSPWRPWRRSQGRPRPGWRSRAPATRPPSAGSRTGTCCLNTHRGKYLQSA